MTGLLRIVWIVVLCITTNTSKAAAVAFFDVNRFDTNASVINFETGNTAVPVIAGIEIASGVSSLAPGEVFEGSAFFDFQDNYGLFGNQALGNVTANGHSSLSVEFDNAVEAVGAWIGTKDQSTDESFSASHLIVAAFDSNSNLLGQVNVELSNNPGGISFVGFQSAGGITRLEWLDLPNDGWFAIDNITYGNLAPVPLPASLWLFGSGVLFLASICRRRKIR